MKPFRSSLLVTLKLVISVQLLLALSYLDAQPLGPPSNNGPRQMRSHTATQSHPLRTVPASESLRIDSEHVFKRTGDALVVRANAIPEHAVGRFPNRGNPHSIQAQNLSFALPLNPSPAKEEISMRNTSGRGAPNTPFGIAANGVLFDPGTAEFFQGDREADWNYEALGGAINLGLDGNHAHVQPNGSYHYHGLPTGLLKELKVQAGTHSPLVGFAMDGYPIYALYGYRDAKDPNSPVIELRSSWQLKDGERPNSKNEPGGRYDGTFSKDYEYIAGSGDLDACNGRFTITKDFPQGTYAYFLTEDWPVIPRYFKAKPLKLRGERRGSNRPPSGRP